MAFAQDVKTAADAANENTVSTEQKEAGPASSADQEVDPEGTTMSERILALEAAIEADQKALNQLEEQIQLRQTRFRRMSEELEQIKQELEQKSEQKEKLLHDPSGKTPPADMERLDNQIQRLTKDIQLIQSQSNLEVEAVKTERQQVETLKEKIKRNQAALDSLTGTEKPVAETRDAVPTGAVAEPGAEAVPPTSPADLMMPGKVLSTPDTQPKDKAAGELPETTEQIEAREEAEKKEQEAKQAEKAVVDYVARKRVLEEQIAQETELLKTAEQTQGNYEQYLSAREAELEEQIASGVSHAKLDKVQKEIGLLRTEIRKIREDIKRRSSHIRELNEQLNALQSEQLRVVQEAADKRKEAEAARKKSIWLESPFHPQNILRWVMTRGPRILMTVLVIGILLLITRLTFARIARLMIRKGRGEEESRVNRAETLAISFRSVVQMIIVVVGTLIVFEEAGIDIATVLGGAAIIGLAVAFGAQNLMRDYFTGFMILIEDQYELGDLVTIGDATGVVEKVNMRTTVLRDLEGRVHFVPNGQIRQVTNRTYEWARAVFDIAVAYKEDVDRVMALLVELANEMRVDPDYKDDIIEEPLMLGVDGFGDAAVTIKFMLKTKPDKMFPIRRELLRRIKNRFDEEGIQIPIPHRIIFQQTET